MIIKSSEFITSATTPVHYPSDSLPEFAFAGRSNVGKSSLVNVLLNRKKLVKTSSKPGRTQTLNFFSINNAFFFVDLPGYGYARVAKTVRNSWGPMVETYLKTRTNLKAVVVLLDIRRRPGPEEMDLKTLLHFYRIPVIWVLTKADKLSRSKQVQQKSVIGSDLSVQEEDLTLFSAKSRQGRNRLWHRLAVFLPQTEDALENRLNVP